MSIPLLVMPGMLCDDTAWAEQAAALADVGTMSMASYGEIDAIPAMAEAALANAPPRFALAGHSMGGRVALAILERAPDRVLGLALMGTDFRAPQDDAERATEAQRHEARLALAAAKGMEGFGRVWARKVVSPSRTDDTALRDAIVAMTVRHSRTQLAAQLHAGFNRPDFAHVLPGIACPTLIVAGSDDAMRPVAVHREMAARIAGSELLVLEGCGHMMTMEEPDAVSAAMRRWLSRCAAHG
jgi:pimeloyl-ACP methyl ester carboxylesterase